MIYLTFQQLGRHDKGLKKPTKIYPGMRVFSGCSWQGQHYPLERSLFYGNVLSKSVEETTGLIIEPTGINSSGDISKFIKISRISQIARINLAIFCLYHKRRIYCNLNYVFFYMLECSNLAESTTGLRQSHFKINSACSVN